MITKITYLLFLTDLIIVISRSGFRFAINFFFEIRCITLSYVTEGSLFTNLIKYCISPVSKANDLNYSPYLQ